EVVLQLLLRLHGKVRPRALGEHLHRVARHDAEQEEVEDQDEEHGQDDLKDLRQDVPPHPHPGSRLLSAHAFVTTAGFRRGPPRRRSRTTTPMMTATISSPSSQAIPETPLLGVAAASAADLMCRLRYE